MVTVHLVRQVGGLHRRRPAGRCTSLRKPLQRRIQSLRELRDGLGGSGAAPAFQIGDSPDRYLSWNSNAAASRRQLRMAFSLLSPRRIAALTSGGSTPPPLANSAFRAS